MSNLSQSPHRKRAQKNQYPFGYFCLKFQSKFQFLRVELNPDYFSSFGQLKQHLSNHFTLNDPPNLYLINDNGKFSQIKDELKIPDDVENNSIFFVEPNGMTPESIFPDFAAKVYADPDQSQKEKAQKHIIPENITVVKKIFEDWPLLLQTIHKINTKNLTKSEMEGSHKKDERRSKKKDEETEEFDKKKKPIYTVQSLFTETGDFSDLFYAVANKMKIHISSNPEYGSPLRSKRKSSS